MRTEQARNVVVGAGAMGLATAYHLAKRGEPVRLIEQFAIGHDRGSSHGSARITRHSYADVRYARLMPAAFAAWRELEADAGESLYLRIGGLSLCPPGVDYVGQVTASLAAIGCPHRRMTGRELRELLPVFGVPDDQDVVFEPDAGMILAERALAAMLRLADASGLLEIDEDAAVRRIDLDADDPTIVLGDRKIVAERLIVTAGSWTARLFPEFASRLRPERQQVLYFAPVAPGLFTIGRMPVFISVGAGPKDLYYGMPSVLAGGVKVARHGGEPIDPDLDDRQVSEDYCEEIRSFLRGTMPQLADDPIVRTEICKYTVAENEDFRIGSHPRRDDVIVASPCSGHGFKFAALIGRMLADHAINGPPGASAWCDWSDH